MIGLDDSSVVGRSSTQSCERVGLADSLFTC